MNKKLKLALAIGLGGIVSTAAITTMAVSCSNEPEKPEIVKHENGKYNPTPEIGNELTLVSFNKMKANLEKLAEKLKAGLSDSKATNVQTKTMIELEGSTLTIGYYLSGDQDKGQYVETLTDSYNLIPNQDKKFQVVSNGLITDNGVSTPNNSVNFLTLEQLKQRLQPIYDGSIANNNM